MEPYRLPTATVLASDSCHDRVTTIIEISRCDYLSYPIAPASLWRLEDNLESFRLHQLVEREGNRLQFETYSPSVPPPEVGSAHRFCSWWIPVAMDAVRDKSALWKRLAYADYESHDHCLLTWERISASDERNEGYCSRHGWITVEAYRESIEQDRFHFRSDWRSIE